MIQACICCKLYMLINFCSYHLEILNGKIATEDANVNGKLSTKNKWFLGKIHIYFSWVVSLLTFPPLDDNTHQVTQEHGDPLRNLDECQTTDRMALSIWKVVKKWKVAATAVFPTATVYLCPRIHWEPSQSLEVHTHLHAEMRLR